MRNAVPPVTRTLLGVGILWIACLGLPCSAQTGVAVPPTMVAQANEANADLDKKDYEAAARIYQSVIKAYPDSVFGWCYLGLTRLRQGRLNDAREALVKAVAVCPTCDYATSNLGITYYLLNQNDNAIQYLQAAIALNPDFIESHMYLGKAYEKAGKKKEAGEEYHKVAELAD